MKMETVIQKEKKRAIAMNMNTGTRIVWHYCWVNSAVVFITIMPILILRMQHRSTRKDMPAMTKAVIAILRIIEGSWPLITVILIFPSADIKHTTPKATIAPKYSTMTEITKHPPQALIKNSNKSDNISVMKIIVSEIGHVVFRSAIDSSKKLRPKSIV